MPSVEENYLLLWSLLQQKMSATGQIDNIDWSIIASNLKIDTVNAARVRFHRLKEDFSKLGFPGLPNKTDGQNMTGDATQTLKSPKATKTKTANPKARAAVEKKKTGVKGKKGKVGIKKSAAVVDEKDEDEADEELAHEVAEDEK